MRLSSACALFLKCARPAEEVQQVPFFAPGEAQHIERHDFFRLHAGVGFHAPLEVFATPRAEAMAAGGVPQKTNGGEHRDQYRRRMIAAVKSRTWQLVLRKTPVIEPASKPLLATRPEENSVTDASDVLVERL